MLPKGTIRTPYVVSIAVVLVKPQPVGEDVAEVQAVVVAEEWDSDQTVMALLATVRVLPLPLELNLGNAMLSSPTTHADMVTIADTSMTSK